MANVPKYFEQFHEKIRADYDMNKTLREKRDTILKLIRKRLKEADRPGFDELMQGSYAVGAGVQPIGDLEFDIDVGLRFAFSEKDYDAKDVRKWVFDAVNGHTDSVEEKGPCIRVGYSKGYHVDLVVYAHWEESLSSEQFRLAHRSKGWRPADPPTLLEYVKNARQPYEGTEDSNTKTDQLRRVVRYLKRWSDVAIPYESDAKPTGLAFLLFAIEHLQPTKFWDGKADDRSALETLAIFAANQLGRLVVHKLTPEYEDLFAKLSDEEMTDLKRRFDVLAEALRQAKEKADPAEACAILREVFGNDFPVPDPQDTAKKTPSPAIIPSSSSA